jgi:putative transposase
MASRRLLPRQEPLRRRRARAQRNRPGDAGHQRAWSSSAREGHSGTEIAGANGNDHKLLKSTIEAVVIDRPDPDVYEQHLCLDRATPTTPAMPGPGEAGYISHIRRIGEEKFDNRGVKRYPARQRVVERTFAWSESRRAILIRYDKKAENYLGRLIQLACVLLWYRRLHQPRQAQVA